MADLHVEEDQYCFPSHISPSSLCPDLVLWSDTLCRFLVVELTVCFETGFEEAADWKQICYLDLLQMGRKGIIDEN